MLKIYKPKIDELWFKQLMMSDKETMSYNHAYGGSIPFPKERWKSWYERWIGNDNLKMYYRYLRDLQDNFVGEISYHFDDDKGLFMCDVLIYAKYRGRGYGKEGLNLLYEIAKENGISMLYDEIAIDNPAIQLFLKQGFFEENRSDKAVLLKKKL